MLSFSRTQYIAIGLLLLVMILLSAVSLQTFVRMDDAIRTRLIKQQQIIALLSDISVHFTQSQSEFKSVQLGSNQTADRVLYHLDEVDKNIKDLSAFDDQDNFNINIEIDLFTRENRRYRTALYAFMEARNDGPSSDYVQESLRKIDEIIEDVVHNAMTRHSHFEQMRKSTVAMMLEELDQSYSFLIAMMLLGISLAGAIFLWLTSRLHSIVEEILDVTKLLADGNFSCRLFSRHNDSLGQLCHGIDSMAECLERTENKNIESLEEAQQGNRIKSQFLANMSHEIRTPMTAILGFADMVYEEVSDPSCKEKLNVIRRNGRYLIDIINDILDLSKIEANHLCVERIPIDSVKLIQELIQLHQEKCSEKNLCLQMLQLTGLPNQIFTDPTRLKQIVNNLLSNAIKFSEDGNIKVQLGMFKDKGNWMFQIQVKDTGIGMDSNQLNNVFDAFSQADNTTTRKYGGTGLGLTISRKLSQLLGGDLTACSIEGEGSTFTLSINPGSVVEGMIVSASRSVVNKAEQKDASLKTEKEKCDAPLKDIRLLLVEDGPDNQILIKHLMTKAGATVELADNGQIALDRLADGGIEDFDLILMDMQMPVLDGYKATTKLRELGFDIPVIAVTANAMSSDEAKSRAAGCDDFVPKPINKTKLIEKIRIHLKMELVA